MIFTLISPSRRIIRCALNSTRLNSELRRQKRETRHDVLVDGRRRPGSGGRADGVGSPTTTAEREHEATATALRAGCGETRSSSSTSACWTPTPDLYPGQNPTFDSMQVVRPHKGPKRGDRDVPRAGASRCGGARE